MILLAACLPLAACYTAEAPPGLRRLEVSGTPYQRGVQHGKALSSEIRSFYTTMLATSLLPYLNREQADISSVLKSYDALLHPEYGNGQFSFKLLTDSAFELEKSISQDHRDEMHGIADGAQLPYEQILLLNTFVDSTLAARSITYFLRTLQSPTITFVEFDTTVTGAAQAIETDGIDNDGDGQTDENHEGRINYAAKATASMVEVPTNAKFRVLLADPDGVDPKSVRLQLVVGGKATLFTPADKALTALPFKTGNGEVSKEIIEVWLTPPTPLPPGAVVTLSIQAGDAKINLNPPPAKTRTMRIEQLTFSTAGYGKKFHEIPNLGASDGTTQPPSLAFAAHNGATVDGKALIGHHFTLLDAGTSHKHCVMIVHKPVGKPAFALAGWAGVAYGLAGVSARGVAVAATNSESLNNPLVGRFAKDLFNAKLIDSGIPVGFAIRQVLESAATTQQASDQLLAMKHSFGWNFIIADAAGDLKAVEVHSAVFPDQSQPIAYGVGEKDEFGKPLASATGDDLMIGAHFRKLATDIETNVIYDVPPQRAWSIYYYPSLRAQAALQAELQSRHGKLSAATVEDLLRLPPLVDRHDSMQAAIIEPAARRIRVAAGSVPATDQPFEIFELPAFGGVP